MDWQAYVEAALTRERAAGHMTRRDADVLHLCLDRLAFNMTFAGQPGEIPKPVATTWLLYTHRRRLRSQPQVSPGEQAQAARCWAWGTAASLLRESEQSIAFAEPALRDYFCLHYCQTHPLNGWLLRRTARPSFGEIWRSWAEQDHGLIGRLLGVLRGTAEAPARAGAALVLGHIGDPSAVEALIEALDDGSDAVRLRAAQALLMLGDRRAVEPLTALLRHRQYSVRVQTVEILEAFGDPRAVEPLMELFNDPVLQVRFRAAQTVGKLADMREVDEVIATLLAAPADQPLTSTWIAKALEGARFSGLLLARLIRQRTGACIAVIEALGRCGEPAVPVLTRILGQPFNPDVLSVAVEALGATGAPQAVEPLVRLAHSHTIPRARQAVQALGRLGNRPALDALVRMRESRWLSLRQGAAMNAAIAAMSKHLQQGQKDAL